MQIFRPTDSGSRRGLRTILLVSSGLLAGAFSGAVQAQGETANTAAEAVNTLTVIGHAPSTAGEQVTDDARFGILGRKTLHDTPFSVTSFTEQLIEERQARYLSDILTADPSVRNATTGNSFDQFVIRGFPVTNANVAIDGLYGVAPLYRIGLEAYERVELIKGPSALLNGMAPSGAVGGAINLIPKRAGAKPVTTVGVDYGSGSQFGVKADVGRRFGAEDSTGVRANGVYRAGDTAIDNQSDEYALGTLSLDHRSASFRLSVNGGYQFEDMKGPLRTTNIALGIAVPAAPDARINYAPRWARSIMKDSFGQARAEYFFGSGFVFTVAGGGHHYYAEDVRYLQTIINAAGNTMGPQLYAITRVNDRTAETSLRGEFLTGGLRHEFAVQAMGYTTENKTAVHVLGAPLSSNIYKPVDPARPVLSGIASTTPKISDLRLASVAIADVISTQDRRVQLTLGGRLQQVRARNFSAMIGNITNTYQENAFSPSVALLYKATGAVSLYGNYIEGLAQGPSAPLTAKNAGEVFKPQATRQFETGVKLDLQSFGMTASLFQITQPSGFTDPVSNVFAVDGRQRNRGLELNMFGHVLPGLRALGGLALTDGKLTQTRGGANDGNTAPAAPKTQVSFGLDWAVTGVPEMTVNGQVVHTGSQFYDFANTQKIGQWTRFDTGARYTLPDTPFALTVNVENLFNHTYWASTATAGGGTSGGLLRGLPRTLRATISADF